jgi:glycosyltransferase involved in cell wall biosynthesis
MKKNKKKKILHLTEAYGGGVAYAINCYIRSSNIYEHYICASLRKSDISKSEIPITNITILPKSLKSFILFYKIYKKINPKYVHIHSSFAGFIGRLMFFIPKKKIIYTPHAYSFLRNDNWILVQIYKIIEKLLAFRTFRLAACSKEEFIESINFYNKKSIFPIYNASDIKIKNLSQSEKHKKNIFNVAMIGRISKQKGINFFIKTYQLLKAPYKDKINFIWIGDGNLSLKSKLLLNNIKVTGWLKPREVLKKLIEVDLYFHSAAWEGFPLSVLEAAKVKKPLLLRKIKPFTLENLYVVDNPEESSKIIRKISKGDVNLKKILNKNFSIINKNHSLKNLKKSLLKLYG